ncbi:MAG: glycosyl hydrolase [Chloroflexi bacterium]|nr:glycosyl hydrolase [Chloroflexota bacterium]
MLPVSGAPHGSSILRHLVVALVIPLLALLPAPVAAAPQSGCTFQLGFAALHALIPGVVGSCVDNAAYSGTTGDALQHTTNGLLVWRKAGNLTAFTDGYHSWINSPYGLVERLNSERFPWEPDFTGDPRFAVVLGDVPPDAALHALNLLHARWVDGSVPPAMQYAPTHLQAIDSSNLSELATLAALYPGRVWSLQIEPNGISAGSPYAQPAAYARLLHSVATTLKRADPTARLIGPDVLNWTEGCELCGPLVTGESWTVQMRADYVAAYGAEPPFDVWSIHTYPLDWAHLPTVNYKLEEQQLVEFRSWLDSIPGLAGKPIWDTELGVHWGYTGFRLIQQHGHQIVVPAGRLRAGLVADYLQQMLSWLVASGQQYNIRRWFVFAAYNPDSPGDHAGAVSLLSGPGSDSQLTPDGEIFVHTQSTGQ